MDDLGDREMVEVSLASDRLNPALLNVEGGALGLSGGIAHLEQGCFPLLPPGYDFCEVAYHRDKLVIVDRRYTLGGHIEGRRAARTNGTRRVLLREHAGLLHRHEIRLTCRRVALCSSPSARSIDLGSGRVGVPHRRPCVHGGAGVPILFPCTRRALPPL